MFSFHSIQQYHEQLINGQTTCVEAVRHYIEAISANMHLNAWLEVYENEALAKAQLLDEQRKNGELTGKLHGVIIGLKDVICYEGHTVSASSKMLQNYIAIYNATAVQRLLDEEAIIIGRNNCDEFAMGSSGENSAFGPVKNFADNERVSGGSSGGSAVAVQSGTCMVSLGSDTGGSVRQPADFCGVIGFKPSYGTISRYGLIAYASSFDQIGIFAKEIDDVQLLLNIISGPDEYDSTVSFQPLNVADEKKPIRIAYFKNALLHPSLDPEIKENILSFIETLTKKGYEIKGIDFEYLEYIVPAYYVLTTAEASSNFSRYDGVKFGHRTSEKGLDLNTMYKLTRSEGFGNEVKKRILLGTFVLSAGYYDAYYTKAQEVRRKLLDKTNEIFSQFDAIIMPTVPTPAFKLGEKKTDPIEMFLADIYTVYANLVGIPAIALPLFTHSSGLPFGLQVMTSKYNELSLLRFSKELIKLNKDGK